MRFQQVSEDRDERICHYLGLTAAFRTCSDSAHANRLEHMRDTVDLDTIGWLLTSAEV